MSDSEKANPQGRPSKYQEEYCEAVIADGALGFSLTAFAGGIMVDRTTISEWRRVHPEFDVACRQAMAVRARFLEGGMLKPDVAAPAMNARKFALVNCAPEDWREKQAVELSGPDGGPIETVGWVSNADEETLKKVAALKGL